MAAQCGVNNAASMFVSSNAYYGYVPVNQSNQTTELHAMMDIDNDNCTDKFKKQRHEFIVEQQRRCIGAKKRSFGHEDVAAYMPRFKRFREEAVVTNVFSMVQETASGQKNIDLPRCTMSHYYV